MPRNLAYYVSDYCNKISNSAATSKRRAPHQISPSYSSTSFTSPPFPGRHGFSIPVGLSSEALPIAKKRRQTREKRTKRRRRQGKRIDVLPDDVLLEIFDFYMDAYPSYSSKRRIESWQSLVHVCRRWRNLVLGSPRRLNLQLCCTPETPVRDTLDVWPALPLIVEGNIASSSPLGTNNIIAALGRSNRVCHVFLDGLADSKSEDVLAAMQVPFPELTAMRLSSDDGTPPGIPDSLLNGSAPHLRIFVLEGIPFPGLPNLHLSANHLVSLRLWKIPHSGYISPEVLVALLSMLSSLEELILRFQSPQSRPDRETPPPPPSKRSVIPALISLNFEGVIEYLEALVTGIDAPQLDHMRIVFFNQIDFDTPRTTQFINRTPKLRPRDAHVEFKDKFARVGLQPDLGTLEIAISCTEPDWQLSSIEQVCNFSLHPLSAVEDLCIKHEYSELVWKDDAIENTLWLQLFLPFTAVKNLYLSKEFATGIAAALKELVGRRTTEVLPSLQNLFVKGLERSGTFQETIGQFVAARQLLDHPIAVSVWDKDSKMKPMYIW